MNAPRGLTQQSGVALLVVMLILAVMVVVATGLNERSRLELQRTSNMLHYQQAREYAAGAEAYIPILLKQSLKKDTKVVNLDQGWSKPVTMRDDEFADVNDHGAASDSEVQSTIDPTQTVQNELSQGATATVVDLSNCFNLNSLLELNKKADPNPGSTPPPPNKPGANPPKDEKLDAGKAAQQTFMQILKNQGVSDERAKVIVASTLDWISSKDYPSSQGAGDEYYSGLAVPYLTAKSPMVDRYELRVVRGMTGKLFHRIRHQICALPEQTFKININTIATDQVGLLLSAMGLDLGALDTVRTLIKNRPLEGWAKVDELTNKITLNKEQKALAQANLAVTSNYFMAEIQGYSGDATARMLSFYRQKDGKAMLLGHRIGGFE